MRDERDGSSKGVGWSSANENRWSLDDHVRCGAEKAMWVRKFDGGMIKVVKSIP